MYRVIDIIGKKLKNCVHFALQAGWLDSEEPIFRHSNPKTLLYSLEIGFSVGRYPIPDLVLYLSPSL
jgi:hypothetical protein